MKYKNAPKLLAEEAWRMITDECKEKMTSLKEPYIESLTEDISHFINKTQDDFAIGFLSWYKTDGKWITKHLDNKELLETYKKEKGL